MTNCRTCTYYSDICAVNPTYRDAMRRIENSSHAFRELVEPLLLDCKDFNQSPARTLTITLSENEWKEIAKINDPIPEAQKLIEKIRASFPPAPQVECKEGLDDIPF